MAGVSSGSREQLMATRFLEANGEHVIRRPWVEQVTVFCAVQRVCVILFWSHLRRRTRRVERTSPETAGLRIIRARAVLLLLLCRISSSSTVTDPREM